MKKYTIKSISHLCLYDNAHIDKSIEFVNSITSIIEDPETKQVCIDFGPLKKLTAAANYVFCLFTHYQTTKNNNILNIKMPNDQFMKDLFVNTGLFTAIRAGGSAKIKKLWLNSNFVCGNNSDAPKLLTAIRNRSGVSQLPIKLTAAIRETLLNVNHHAYSHIDMPLLTWWCYFHIGEDDNGKFLSAVILDRGKGIPQNIKDSFPLLHQSFDCECISHAMMESITSTKELGRGKGSVDMKKPVRLNKVSSADQLFVISHKGKYSYEFIGDNDKIVVGSLNNSLKGTMIEWVLYY